MTSDEHDPLIGQVLLGKLDVIRPLGAGGMGTVYEVEHLITHHRRALKIIRPELVKRRTYMKRLIREAGVAGTLNTPYVVDTYDAGTLDDGSVYILMELLEGRSLYDLIQRERQLTVPRLIGIIAQVCEGVGVAHRAGIIHRDLKPDNIFLLPGPGGQEQVKIMDFGISKFEDPDDEVSRLTNEGVVLGTPFYMSPEQARGRALDPRSDVYAIGVMMYEALSGQLPFQDASIGALFIKIASGEYLPLRHHRPDIPDGLAGVVERAMHRKRDARYASMDELRASLLPFGEVGTKVRAKTLSDHPISPRSTAAYGGSDGKGSAPPPAAEALLTPSNDNHGVTPSWITPLPAGRRAASATPPTDIERPPSDADAGRRIASDAPATVVTPSKRSRSKLVPALAAAALLAVAVGVGIALRDDEPTAPSAQTEEPPPATDPGPSEPESAGAEADPPTADSVMEAAEPPPGSEDVAEPAGSRPETSPTRMRRQATTPAEQAGLELSPYGE